MVSALMRQTQDSLYHRKQQEKCLDSNQISDNLIDYCNNKNNKPFKTSSNVDQTNNDDNIISFQDSSYSIIGFQLISLICILFLSIYLLDFIFKSMTNFISKILGSERRRSVASGSSSSSSSNQQQAQHQDTLTEQRGQRYGSTLSLPRGNHSSSNIIGSDNNNNNNSIGFSNRNSNTNTNDGNSTQAQAAQNQRRASRSSVHSISAILFGALTGQSNGNAIHSSYYIL